MLSKPAHQIGIPDIESLIASNVPEGEQIEFKKSLSTKGYTADPWEDGKNKIGDRAKDALLKEAVGFANAYGGAVLLGIRESEAKPPVAAKIVPIQRCADLAERLKLVFRDRVEPQLPRIDIFAVPTEGENGVVIIRVGRSRLAPHRVTRTLVCPIRRADRCEEMSMREIQDMTLNVSRGLERLERQLSEHSERFRQEFKRLQNPGNAWGIRLTAAPVGDEIRIDRVFRQGGISEEFNEPWHKVLQGENSFVGLESMDMLPNYWQPRLRSARAERELNFPNNLRHNSYRELHWDGLIELGFVSCRGEKSNPFPLLPGLPIEMFANLAVWADCIRRKSLAPTAEYALEFEVISIGGPVGVYDNSDSPHLYRSGPPALQAGTTTFPNPHFSSLVCCAAAIIRPGCVTLRRPPRRTARVRLRGPRSQALPGRPFRRLATTSDEKCGLEGLETETPRSSHRRESIVVSRPPRRPQTLPANRQDCLPYVSR